MLFIHILEPGDATRYTLITGVAAVRPDWPFFMFGLGVGEQRGNFLIFPCHDIPRLSFSYFQEKIAMKDYHTCQVAFTAWLHIVGMERFQSDTWEREADLKVGWLGALPSLARLMEEAARGV